MQAVKIYYLERREKMGDDLFREFLSLLPDSFRAEINAYKHWESAQASLLGKMLLLYGLRKACLPYTLNDLKSGPKDRPYLGAGIDFNISHSGDYVILALAEGMKVGVDIEKHRKLDVSLFRKYFDEKEWDLVEHSADPMQTFFELWAAKESAIKCDGRGVEVLSDTHVVIKERRMTPKVSCRSSVFHFRTLPIDPVYACSLCMEQEADCHLEHLTISGLASLK